MGLDMYLYRRTYISDYTSDRKKAHTITRKQLHKDYHHIDPKKIKYIVEEIGYWRKFHDLHQAFVRIVQNGVDDCGDYNVYKEHLTQLIEWLEERISYEYNKIISDGYKKALKLFKKLRDNYDWYSTIFYHASW